MVPADVSPQLPPLLRVTAVTVRPYGVWRPA
jgi:hypothetical protein